MAGLLLLLLLLLLPAEADGECSATAAIAVALSAIVTCGRLCCCCGYMLDTNAGLQRQLGHEPSSADDGDRVFGSEACRVHLWEQKAPVLTELASDQGLESS